MFNGEWDPAQLLEEPTQRRGSGGVIQGGKGTGL